MDYNIKDVEKTVAELRQRVDELERLLDGQERHEFKYSAAEQLYHQRVSRQNVKAGESHTDWENVPIVADASDILPDGDATNNYLVWDVASEVWLAGAVGLTTDYCYVGKTKVTIPAKTTNFLKITLGGSPAASWVAGMPAGDQAEDSVVFDVTKNRVYIHGSFAG